MTSKYVAAFRRDATWQQENESITSKGEQAITIRSKTNAHANDDAAALAEVKASNIPTTDGIVLVANSPPVCPQNVRSILTVHCTGTSSLIITII
mmetsp:Transcript_49367/g.148676  ORF Transcript_49367/g.148676 Transcript_49367/m.148676 type:complete len:95 (-) Transcript_49367:1070-1354(-)